MINQARTLLLNYRTTGPGSEYMPPEYTPKKLPDYLQDIWFALFGRDTTESAKNYRARQLMAILHSTYLVSYVTGMDSRITYLPTATDMYEPELEGLLPLAELPDILRELLEHVDLFYGSLKYDLSAFDELWQASAPIALRLSALLLAYIYRVEDSDEVEGH